MAEVKKVMQLVEKSIGHINENYDMSVENIEDIRKASMNTIELVINGFRFGYMQGMKAARAEMKK